MGRGREGSNFEWEGGGEGQFKVAVQNVLNFRYWESSVSGENFHFPPSSMAPVNDIFFSVHV